MDIGDEPAFARTRAEGELCSAKGLTKREYFAGLAMMGFIAGCYAGNNAGFTVHGNCFAAVDYADALLAELAKNTKERN